jgi:outer membrane protein assembly factor BamB
MRLVLGKRLLSGTIVAVVATSVVAGETCAQSPLAPSPPRTRTVLLSFIDAYDHHDLARTLSFFTHPLQGRYFDCDFPSLAPVTVLDLTGLRRWLRVQFAQGDQFSSARVEADNPEQPYVAAISATRSNNILGAMGVRPVTDTLASKFILDATTGTAIAHGGWVASNECGDPHATPSVTLRFPQGASKMRTRALVQAFIDGYNAGLSWRVLALMGTRVRYSDSGAPQQRAVTITDRTKLSRWLRARFHVHDNLGQAVVVAGDPSGPFTVTVRIRRTSTAVSRNSPSPLDETLTVTVGGPRFDHITRVQIGAATVSSRLARIPSVSSWLQGWPMEGRDPQRTYRSPAIGATNPHLLFQRKNTHVLVTGPDGRMYAPTAAYSSSGRQIWRLQTPGGDPPALTRSGTLVVTGGTNARHVFNLLGIGSDGKILWRIRPFGFSKGAVMLAAPDGNVYSPIVGPPESAIPWTSPHIGTNVVSPHGKILRKLPAPLYHPALAPDGTLYGVGPTPVAGTADLYAYASDHSLLWQQPWQFPVPYPSADTVGPLIGRDGRLYLGVGTSLIAITPSGQRTWTVDKGDQVLALAERADGVLLAAGKQNLEAFDSDGHRLWSVPIGATDALVPPASMLVVDAAGTAYVGSGDGLVRVVSSAGALLAMLEAGGRHAGYASTLLLGPTGRLIVDGTDGTLRVYG